MPDDRDPNGADDAVGAANAADVVRDPTATVDLRDRHEVASAQSVGSQQVLGTDQTAISQRDVATDKTVASQHDVASAETVASTEAVASAETVASVEAVASAETVASVEAVASAETVASVEAVASAETIASARNIEGAETGSLVSAANSSGTQVVRESFGSFEVMEQLGAGGMGVVFAAHDAELDRKVAIKVLHPDPVGRNTSERLLREAQAMAQLSHPNVITVHQVGEHDGRVFVVMEYVDGGTLRQWVAAEERDWRAVLEAYCEAGKGLVAAHEAGLIHRDFKPDNVLVRPDERVLVTDFGLAATAGEVGSVPARAPGTPSTSTPSRFAMQLTRTGEVMGTPMYMAPEQHKGARSDARADQFAFCASLFEALYGVRAFDGQSYRELFASVFSGRPAPAPEDAKVPAWIYRVLIRGLQLDPDDRYPDMSCLLDALSRNPLARRRRRMLMTGVALMAVALVVAVVALWPETGRARCKKSGEPLAEVWNDHRRSALRTAWAGAVEQISRVIASLDLYGEAWAHERVSACEATFVAGEQSELLFDRRMLCLERRLSRMRALIAELERQGVRAGDAAIQAVARLPRFAECRDRETLVEIAPPPDHLRERVTRVWEELDKADALRLLGDFGAAQGLAQAAAEEAGQIDYAPLRARSAYLVGFVAAALGDHKQAEQRYREALRFALQAKTPYLEAEVWLSLIYMVGHTTGQSDAALALATAAEAAVTRAGNDAALKGRLEGNLGLILTSKGDYVGARRELERSVQTFAKSVGPNDLDAVVARNNLAMLLERMGEYEAAQRELEQVLAVRERVLGADHPAVATALNDMGNAAQGMGDLKRAKTLLRRALDIRRRALGAEHQRTAHTLNNLAIVQDALGETAEAMALAREAVRISEKHFGKDHPEMAGPLNTLGLLLRQQGQRKAAWEAFARALANVEYARGREHVETAPMLENLAGVLSELGQVDEALRYVDRAIGVRQRATGLAHLSGIQALALRGGFNMAAGRFDAAVGDFHRQRETAVKAHGQIHPEVAQAEYNRGLAYEKKGDLVAAEKGYRSALVILEHSESKEMVVASLWRGLGDIASLRRELGQAQEHYEKAVVVADGAGSTALGEMLILLGQTQAKRSRWEEAVASLSRAARVLGTAGRKSLVALADFERAKASWSGGIDRAAARKLARRARAVFVSAGADDNVAEIDAWLRRRGG